MTEEEILKQLFETVLRGNSTGTTAAAINGLEAGKKADLILVDLNKSRLTRPAKNLPSMIINFARAGDVDNAIVDGKILLRNGKALFLDEKVLLQEFKAARLAVLKRAGLLTQ